MKKIALAAAVAAIGTLAAATVPFANAQLFIYGATTTASSSVAGTTDTNTSTATSTLTATSSTSSASSSSSLSPTTTSSAPAPTTTVTALSMPLTAGFIQFNGLVVNSIGSITLPTVILANATSTVTCESYATEFADIGMIIPCPMATSATSANTSSTTTSTIPFQVNLTSATQLLLSDRTNAILANITPGDTVNVFGYYDGTDMIQAEVIRDLSKPAITGSGASAVDSATVGPATIANLQTEIEQIQTILTQLITQINTLSVNARSTISTMTASTTATASTTIQ
jgi:hypothetical protein